ncbi:MAG: serine--tRNA ligase [Oscillospiraceae bacterium]|nr:serine--tRNA ligase [Oscillospiraceae bacterium]MBP5239066.1 serine--tRNA ligase [Oscillospiraceae bacterium]MBP5743515.1 serine--tRNA ligase [Oscillospiraceae bacterium]
MLDIKFVRDNPELVRDNIRKKYQDAKLPLVDEVIDLDAKNRAAITEASELRARKNQLSKANGPLFGKLKKASDEEKPAIQAQIDANMAAVKADDDRLAELERLEETYKDEIYRRMLLIPNIIDPSVPIGPDDSANVEVQRFGEPVVPDYEVPYHTEIMERFNGIDMDAAGRTSGNGFYYLMGDIARLHSAVLAYARDFMIGKGFTYCIPPFMIHGNVVQGVMSQTEMDAMMYKIEGEDLYLIGTSEHSMIGKFIDQILTEDQLPQTLTSYSPCFRKEKGAHGIEERGVYRIHQFEKQEMIVVCKPEDSMAWYEKMWRFSVELFRSMEIPVRQLECCSGDLADLKVKSCDIEAWSPRQKKYFEVCSCSNLSDAQARRLKIRVKSSDGKTTYLPHTLNNTVVAPPRMLIAFLENHLQADGSVTIPEVLWPYMGGTKVLIPKK